jgi:hypothetical protein
MYLRLQFVSMAFLEHVLEFLLVVTLFGAAVLAVTFLLARSYIRRHWRLVRGHAITRGLVSGLSFLAAGRERWSARATPEQLSQGTAARVRRRMWTAVEDAEIAVAHADSHDAPVAELPSVCRSLRGAAGELDGLLRHERRLPAGARPEVVRRQVADVITAARDVQSAALGAGGDAAAPRVRALVQQAGDEVQIVSAAVSRLRSLHSR